jgi:hypothetical protein
MHSLLFPATKENQQVINSAFCDYSFMFSEFWKMILIDEFRSWKYIFDSVIVVKVMLQILLLCSDEKFSVSIFLLRLNDRVSNSITDTLKLSIYWSVANLEVQLLLYCVYVCHEEQILLQNCVSLLIWNWNFIDRTMYAGKTWTPCVRRWKYCFLVIHMSEPKVQPLSWGWFPTSLRLATLCS